MASSSTNRSNDTSHLRTLEESLQFVKSATTTNSTSSSSLRTSASSEDPEDVLRRVNEMLARTTSSSQSPSSTRTTNSQQSNNNAQGKLKQDADHSEPAVKRSRSFGELGEAASDVITTENKFVILFFPFNEASKKIVYYDTYCHTFF